MNKQEKQICENLWYQFEPALRQACGIKLAGSSLDAEDIVAEVYLALCTKIASGSIPSYPKAWLFGTLHNIMNKQFQQLYKKKQHECCLHECVFTGVQMDFTEEITDKLFLNDMYALFKRQLSKDEKILFCLFYHKELKIKEIARLEKKSENAIKQKNYRLRTKIRCLANENESVD